MLFRKLIFIIVSIIILLIGGFFVYQYWLKPLILNPDVVPTIGNTLMPDTDEKTSTAIRAPISAPTTDSRKNFPKDIPPASTLLKQIPPIDILKNCKVVTYQDKFLNVGSEKLCLDKITIKGIYFVAKNQTSGIKSYWKESMLNILTQIKNFYEAQFENKIQITVDEPIMIYGDNNIEQYGQYLIDKETRVKISIDKSNFTVIMYYPIQGEGDKRVMDSAWGGGAFVGNSSSAMNNWFWLDPDMMKEPDYQGAVLSAHEFGHAIGIPHPWDEEINKDADGNIINRGYGNEEIGSLMSYGGLKGPLIPNAFIRDDIKNKMIIE